MTTRGLQFSSLLFYVRPNVKKAKPTRIMNVISSSPNELMFLHTSHYHSFLKPAIEGECTMCNTVIPVIPGTANLALCAIAGCCHLTNLAA